MSSVRPPDCYARKAQSATVKMADATGCLDAAIGSAELLLHDVGFGMTAQVPLDEERSLVCRTRGSAWGIFVRTRNVPSSDVRLTTVNWRLREIAAALIPQLLLKAIEQTEERALGVRCSASALNEVVEVTRASLDGGGDAG